MNCKNCGEPLTDGMTFCPQCGTNNAPADPVPAPESEVTQPVIASQPIEQPVIQQQPMPQPIEQPAPQQYTYAQQSQPYGGTPNTNNAQQYGYGNAQPYNYQQQNNAPQNYNQPVAYAPSGEGNGKGMQVASLVLGIVGLVFFYVPVLDFFTLVLSIVGIVLGSMGNKKAKLCGLPTGMGTAGLVLSIIATVFGGIGFLSCTVFGLCIAALN